MPSHGVSPPSALGHSWDIRRDPSALCLLCVPIIPYVCMARKHFALTYFVVIFGTWTRCYALTGLCAAKKENSYKYMLFNGVVSIRTYRTAKMMISYSFHL